MARKVIIDTKYGIQCGSQHSNSYLPLLAKTAERKLVKDTMVFNKELCACIILTIRWNLTLQRKLTRDGS